jgi:tRNA pseudouridine38-40 synthase
MARYFIEVAYKGTRFSGFQIQENAPTVQAGVEEALRTLYREPLTLTGSSRTDAGVHALQNFFHFDFDKEHHPQLIYKLNAILPDDIVVKGVYPMADGAHARFDALSRQYQYRVYTEKNPFLKDRAYYFPFTLNEDLLHQAAAMIKHQTDFTAFSKTNTQVKNFNCTILQSHWARTSEGFTYTVEANRFLRGMVRLLTGTMIRTARGKITLADFEAQLHGRKATASVPPHGLYLTAVTYPPHYF